MDVILSEAKDLLFEKQKQKQILRLAQNDYVFGVLKRRRP